MKKRVKKKSISADSKRAKSSGIELVETNPYLRTEKSHKKWFHQGSMGKQDGRPRIAPRERKK